MHKPVEPSGVWPNITLTQEDLGLITGPYRDIVAWMVNKNGFNSGFQVAELQEHATVSDIVAWMVN